MYPPLPRQQPINAPASHPEQAITHRRMAQRTGLPPSRQHTTRASIRAWCGRHQHRPMRWWMAGYRHHKGSGWWTTTRRHNGTASSSSSGPSDMGLWSQVKAAIEDAGRWDDFVSRKTCQTTTRISSP